MCSTEACIEECPVDCIYEGERMLYIHPDECVDCGACEPVCPVEAIFYEDDVPDQWKDYYKVNVEFFADLGSPGGASKAGKIGKDHPVVAALPPQAPRSDPRPALPAFTWDRIAPLGEKARLHPDGVVDLSMGTPVDPVPAAIRRRAGGGRRTRPATRRRTGTPRLRAAAAGWLARSLSVSVSPDDVLPVIGTKEFIAWLPVMLGLGPGDVVVYPELAYPTYDIGARLAGATRGGGRRPGCRSARPGSGWSG